MGKKVFFVGGGDWEARIFRQYGYEQVDDDRGSGRNVEIAKEADYICFTGGSDISTSLYNKPPSKLTHAYGGRDAFEVHMYNQLKDKKKLGICRGGQLLNVLSGGSMWQHVDNHTRGDHKILDIPEKKWRITSSLHHQMMKPGVDANVIAVSGLSTEYWEDDQTSYTPTKDLEDIEVVVYPTTQSLCYQGHPEMGPLDCTDHFFELIERYVP